MLSSSGRAYCGGSQNVPAVLPFGEVPANTKLVKLSKDGGAGSVFSALGSDGWVYSFGSTFGYRFGNGGSTTVTDSTKLSRLAQGAIPLATKLVDVSVGGNVSCAVGDDGSAYCWGNGYFGSLGDGDLTEHTVLVATKVLQGEIPNGVKIMSVRCGTYHCTAYANDKKFYAWGFAEGAAIGQPNGTSNSTASPKLISRVSQN